MGQSSSAPSRSQPSIARRRGLRRAFSSVVRRGVSRSPSDISVPSTDGSVAALSPPLPDDSAFVESRCGDESPPLPSPSDVGHATDPPAPTISAPPVDSTDAMTAPARRIVVSGTISSMPASTTPVTPQTDDAAFVTRTAESHPAAASPTIPSSGDQDLAASPPGTLEGAIVTSINDSAALIARLLAVAAATTAASLLPGRIQLNGQTISGFPGIEDSESDTPPADASSPPRTDPLREAIRAAIRAGSSRSTVTPVATPEAETTAAPTEPGFAQFLATLEADVREAIMQSLQSAIEDDEPAMEQLERMAERWITEPEVERAAPTPPRTPLSFFRMHRFAERQLSTSATDSNGGIPAAPRSESDTSAAPPTSSVAIVPVIMVGLRALRPGERLGPDGTPTTDPPAATTPDVEDEEVTDDDSIYPETVYADTYEQPSSEPPPARSSGRPAQPPPHTQPPAWMIWIAGGVYPLNSPILSMPTLLSGFNEDDVRSGAAYEELLRLAEILGGGKPPTATKQQLDDSLEVVKVSAETKQRISDHLGDSGEQCQICREDYVDDEMVRLLRCRHAFHAFHDEGLVGVAGARTVLHAIAANPACQRLTVSSNRLGDEGLKELAIGLTALRRAGQLAVGLVDLNLSSNGITDVGLVSLVQHLLLPTSEGPRIKPTLRSLLLSANRIRLTGVAPSMLALALSHPSASLVTLSLTNNPIRKPERIEAFLRPLQPRVLRTLTLNVCRLDRRVGPIIAEWLSNPDRCSSLEQLELNGNSLGVRGISPIVNVLVIGANTSLISLETMANDGSATPQSELEDDEAIDDSDVSDDDLISTSPSPSNLSASIRESRDRLLKGQVQAAALRVNLMLRTATIRAALRLLAAARIVMHAQEVETSIEDVNRQIDGGFTFDSLRSALAQPVTHNSAPIYLSSQKGFEPFVRLPSELKVHVLRCLLCLDPVALPSRSGSSQRLLCPLSELQIGRVLAYASDRGTLRHNDTDQRASRTILWLAGYVRSAPIDSTARTDEMSGPRYGFLSKTGTLRWDRGPKPLNA